MTFQLVRKELHALFPFLALVLFFIALDLAFFLVSEFPDQYPLRDLLEIDEDGQEQVSFIIAFALASGLLIREREDGTLTFLDALPITRSKVFFTKVFLGLSVLWLLPVIDFVLRTGVYWCSRTSLETSPPWHLFSTGMVLTMVSTLVYFSLSLALSFLRKFALLVLGLLFSLFLLLTELKVPYVGLFNIFSLSKPVFLGQQWLFPTAKFIVQLGLAAACLGISFAAFNAMGDSSQRLAERVRQKRGMLLLSTFAVIVTLVIWLSLGGYYLKDFEPQESRNVTYRQWPKARANTPRFSFVYPENLGNLANAVINQADAAEEKVRAFLAARAIPRISADLTSSAPHTAGIAHWKNVQVDLAGLAGAEDALAVLAHETTHVYIDHESDSKLSDEFNSTRFFHEGLASYVEHRFFRSPKALTTFKRPAAVARSRNSLRLSELFDDLSFARRHDTDLVYPLGELFVSALIKRYGESAPGQIIRAFNRENAPEDLQGLALWQDVFQACQYNLSEVENLFVTELNNLVATEKEFSASLPRLRGLVSHTPAGPVVTAKYEGTAPGLLLCRFRTRENAPLQQYLEFSSVGNDRFSASHAQFPERTFWYQLGWQLAGAPQPIYEIWTEAPVR